MVSSSVLEGSVPFPARLPSYVLGAQVEVSLCAVGCTVGSLGSQVSARGAFVVMFAEGLVPQRHGEMVIL